VDYKGWLHEIKKAQSPQKHLVSCLRTKSDARTESLALPSGVKEHSKTENSARPPQALASDKSSSRLNHQQNLLLVKRFTDDGGYSGREEFSYDIRNAVLVSANIVEETDEKILPQYGLLGSFHPDGCPQLKDPGDDRIFVNTNIPFSAFICGVQGSGKSHTTSCLLGETYLELLLYTF
jgi:hypothetical protein